MIAIPGRTIVQKTTVVVFLAAYAFMVLMFAVIANDQFCERRLIAAGAKVESTIVSVSPRKNHTWGTIDYRLPSGVQCHDWTELAPNGIVQAGEPLDVAVGQTCGHPVSTKKRLTPWIYLGLCIGGVVHFLYVMWKTSRREVAA
jgi:hypothetical protein